MTARDAGRLALAVLAVHCGLAVLLFWPLVRDPGGRLIRNDDVYGNAWAMAWVVHQAPRAPAHLFDANSFYPRPDTLAYTEPVLPLALQAAPVLLAGGSPILAHNLVLLLTFPLSGLGMYLLAREHAGSFAAGLLASLAYAFSAYRLAHLVHVQSLSIQWLPLALLFTLRALETGRLRDAVLAGAFTLLQVLSSGYYAVMTALALGTTLVLGGRRAWRRGHLRPLLAALGVAAVLAAAVLLPYQAVAAGEAARLGRRVLRGAGQAALFSASWETYASRSGELYPTVTVVLLALLGLVRDWRQPVVRLSAALAVVAVAFSLGPMRETLGVVSPYDLVRRLPGVSMLRTPERLGVLAVLALDLLAAFAVARLARSGRAGRAVVAAAVLTLGVELYPGNIYHLFQPLPASPSAAWLASAPPGPVLELPWDNEVTPGGRYMYGSTRHWYPMVNGWGGFEPYGAKGLGITGRHFPLGPPVRELRAAGVRYVVVHVDEVRPAQRRMLLSEEPLPPGVGLAADFGGERIYTIDPAGPFPKRPSQGADDTGE